MSNSAARVIKICDCITCPSLTHRGGFGKVAYIPFCSRSGRELPYEAVLSRNIIMAKRLPKIPEWCPLEKA